MKTLIGRLLVLGCSVLALGGVGVYAAENPTVVQQAQQIVTKVTDVVNPVPSPSPDPTPTPTDVPSPVVQQQAPPTQVPTPPTPQEFPHNQGPTQQNPTKPGETQEVPVPQTMVFIGATCDQPCSDPNTGGIKCPSPCTITFTADFQGGFAGVTPTFKWSDGGTGQVHVVTYTSASTPHIAVDAYEDYQGITYKVGSANSIPITIE